MLETTKIRLCRYSIIAPPVDRKDRGHFVGPSGNAMWDSPYAESVVGVLNHTSESGLATIWTSQMLMPYAQGRTDHFSSPLRNVDFN